MGTGRKVLLVRHWQKGTASAILLKQYRPTQSCLDNNARQDCLDSTDWIAVPERSTDLTHFGVACCTAQVVDENGCIDLRYVRSRSSSGRLTVFAENRVTKTIFAFFVRHFKHADTSGGVNPTAPCLPSGPDGDEVPGAAAHTVHGTCTANRTGTRPRRRSGPTSARSSGCLVPFCPTSQCRFLQNPAPPSPIYSLPSGEARQRESSILFVHYVH